MNGLFSIEEADKILNDLLPGFNFRDENIILTNYEQNDIIDIYINNETYKIWSVNYIKYFLIEFLKMKIPNCLISQEINDIDFVIINNENNEIIPVELQRSIIDGTNKTFQNAQFEKSIRIQLEDNIRSSGKCWFFFDAEYFRYLQNPKLNKATSIDMKWFVEYMKEEKLKVFVIKYNGLVKELTSEDFNFLKEIHSDDEIILNNNKLKMYRDVLKGYKFTQKEIDDYYEELDGLLVKDKNDIKNRDLLLKSKNSRNVLHSNILRTLRALPSLNEILNMKMVNRTRLSEATYIGIFELVSSHGNRSIMKFVDKFNICQYFPGYVRNKEVWDRYKNCNLSNNQIDDLCKGMYKNTNTLLNY